MNQRQPKYSEEYKKEAVDKVVKLRTEGKGLSEAVAAAGVPRGTIYLWMRLYAPNFVGPKRAYARRVRKNMPELIQVPAVVPSQPRLSGDNRIVLILIENIEAQLKTVKEFIRQS